MDSSCAHTSLGTCQEDWGEMAGLRGATMGAIWTPIFWHNTIMDIFLRVKWTKDISCWAEPPASNLPKGGSPAEPSKNPHRCPQESQSLAACHLYIYYIYKEKLFQQCKYGSILRNLLYNLYLLIKEETIVNKNRAWKGVQ